MHCHRNSVPVIPLCSGAPKTRHFTSYKQATVHALLTAKSWSLFLRQRFGYPRGSQRGGKKAMLGGLFSRRAAIAAAAGCSLLSILGAAAPAAHTAEIKVISTVALTPTLDELTPKYESGSGNKLIIVYSTIADLKKRIEAGETADVMILSRAVLDDLQTQGKVTQGSIVNLGSSYVAIGVRAGAPQPDITTAEKLKEALLVTKSISYADPAKGGASGVYFAKVLDRLGITDQMKSKTVLVPGAQ